MNFMHLTHKILIWNILLIWFHRLQPRTRVFRLNHFPRERWSALSRNAATASPLFDNILSGMSPQ